MRRGELKSHDSFLICSPPLYHSTLPLFYLWLASKHTHNCLHVATSFSPDVRYLVFCLITHTFHHFEKNHHHSLKPKIKPQHINRKKQETPNTVLITYLRPELYPQSSISEDLFILKQISNRKKNIKES